MYIVKYEINFINILPLLENPIANNLVKSLTKYTSTSVCMCVRVCNSI